MFLCVTTSLNELQTRSRLHRDIFTHNHSHMYTKTQTSKPTQTTYGVRVHMHTCTRTHTHTHTLTAIVADIGDQMMSLYWVLISALKEN